MIRVVMASKSMRCNRMKKLFFVALFILLSHGAFAEDFFEGYVVKVLEGDTILLKGGTTVRYMGIDTPQTRVGNQTFKAIGDKALSVNKQMVEKKTVRLELVDPQTRSDGDARKFAYVYVSGQMVNTLLLKKGLAVISRTFPPDSKYTDYFARSQNIAVQKKSGIWSMVQQKQGNSDYAF